MENKEANINEAVVEAMKDTGRFGKLSAEIRAEVFHLLTKEMEHTRSVPLCRENLVINELIREYLTFNGLANTLSVFVREAGQPMDPMNREFLAHNLQIIPKQQTPLINLIVRKNRQNEAVMISSAPTVEIPKFSPLRPIDEPPAPAPIPNSESDASDGFFEINT